MLVNRTLAAVSAMAVVPGAGAGAGSGSGGVGGGGGGGGGSVGGGGVAGVQLQGDCRSAAGSPFSSPSRIAGLPDDIRHFLAFVSKVKKEPSDARTGGATALATTTTTTEAATAAAVRELFPVATDKGAPGKAAALARAAGPYTPAARSRVNSVFAGGNLTPPSERSLDRAKRSSPSSDKRPREHEDDEDELEDELEDDEDDDDENEDEEEDDEEEDDDEDDEGEDVHIDMTPTKPAGAMLTTMRRRRKRTRFGSDEVDVDITGPVQSDLVCMVADCGHVAQSRREYRQHAQSHPKAEQTRYYCTYEGCTKSFCRGYSLKYHQYTHYDNAPFTCREPGCGKKFSHQSRLKRHEFSHHPDERSFPCDYPDCGKRFSQKCHLKIHQQTHARKFSSSALSGGDTSDGFISDV